MANTEKFKLRKISFYILDANHNDYPLEDIEYEIKRALEDYGFVSHFKADEVIVEVPEDKFDESKWNLNSTPVEEYEKEFNK